LRQTYTITANGLEESALKNSMLLLYRGPSLEEKNEIIEAYNLPEDVFDFDDLPTVAPRIEFLYNEKLGDTLIFVFSNIVRTEENSSVEARLETHTFILGQEKMFWITNKDTATLNQELIELKSFTIDSLESVILNAGLLSYTHFTAELAKQKRIIDQLNQTVVDSTKRQVLIDVSETERNMVMLRHTIDTQEVAFTRLLRNESFLEKLDNSHLVHDITWYNRQVQKLVSVYRDLLDTASSLFSDIMSNNLNKLMKFLSSLSLVLGASGLVGELWGMNTGGLPFEEAPYGTWIILGAAFLVGVSMYMYLKNREYFDD